MASKIDKYALKLKQQHSMPTFCINNKTIQRNSCEFNPELYNL